MATTYTLTIGDTVVVLPTITLGTGDTVSNYVSAVECTMTMTNGSNTSSITEDVYLTVPEGVTPDGFVTFDSLTKEHVEILVKNTGLYRSMGNRVGLKFYAEKNNAVRQDAPWKN